MPLIAITVRPDIDTLSCYHIFHPIAFVFVTTCPNFLTFSMLFVVLELSHILFFQGIIMTPALNSVNKYRLVRGLSTVPLIAITIGPDIDTLSCYHIFHPIAFVFVTTCPNFLTFSMLFVILVLSHILFFQGIIMTAALNSINKYRLVRGL